MINRQARRSGHVAGGHMPMQAGATLVSGHALLPARWPHLDDGAHGGPLWHLVALPWQGRVVGDAPREARRHGHHREVTAEPGGRAGTGGAGGRGGSAWQGGQANSRGGQQGGQAGGGRAGSHSPIALDHHSVIVLVNLADWRLDHNLAAQSLNLLHHSVCSQTG